VYEEGDPELKRVSYKSDDARHAGLPVQQKCNYILSMIG
jgi:hypothetical protein